MKDRHILDLCAGTGAWSQPYVDSGYQVHRIDLPDDVRLMKRPEFPVHGILAAPPCTVFARVGARWKRTDNDMREGLSIADACLRMVMVCRPEWWALENPIGRLQDYFGPPVYRFDPCDFGDPWTKRTWLWGDFNQPAQRVPARVILTGKPGSRDRTSRLSGSARRERAKTPPGFASAFFEANP